MISYIQYKRSDGTIIQAVRTNAPTPPQLEVNDELDVLIVEGSFDATTQYINNGLITDRPEMGISIDIDTAPIGEYIRITNVPVGAVLHHPSEGEIYADTVINDGFVEWTSLEPGTFNLSLSKPPMMEEHIDATITRP